MNTRKQIRCIFICCLMGLLAGCGYTTRSLITGKYKTVFVPPFGNKMDITLEADAGHKYKIFRPGLETKVTSAVVNRFLADGTLKRASSQADADLVLEAELIEFRRDPLRYTTNDDVEEYRLNIVVNMRLRDTKENKLVWEEKSFTGDTTYYVIGPQAKSEDTAVTDAITDLSRRIVERVIEQW